MSAGICIMNKNAIALAADSAVTIGQHLAIHNSANKLFALSKVAPVGVIIYSSAEIMGVPVEIVIKQYKKDLAQKTFDTLDEYVNDFIAYLLRNKDLFHFSQNERRYIKDVYSDLLNGLQGDYKLLLSRKIEEMDREPNEEELKAVQQEALDSTIQYIRNLKEIDNYDVTKYIMINCGDEIKEYISLSGLTEKIVLLGKRNDVNHLYNASDCLFFFSIILLLI